MDVIKMRPGQIRRLIDDYCRRSCQCV